ncbi:MAG: endonuclease NucS [Chloroflexi bacterium]|nr:endonuclease NucS [Chloroflexota bacterium]
MEEIEVWAIEGSQAVPIERAEMDLESSLEDTLVAHPDMLLPNLKLVGRQTPVGDGNLDLLGVDGEGKLAVFELKRGTLSRDAVSQVIDYASALEAMSESDLSGLISGNSGQDGIERIEDFVEWYREGFRGSLDSLRPLSMYLVGLGTDDTTRRMVDYLSEHGVDVSLLTFYGFAYSGKTLLAKQVQAAPVVPQHPSREERMRLLESLATDMGVADLMAAARNMFSSSWDKVTQGRYSSPPYPEPTKTGITYYLSKPSESGTYSYPAFSSIQLEKGKRAIKVRFYPRAIELCIEKFNQLDPEKIPFEKQPPRHAAPTDRVKEEILFPLHSLDDWEARKSKLSELTRATFEGWMDEEESQ